MWVRIFWPWVGLYRFVLVLIFLGFVALPYIYLHVIFFPNYYCVFWVISISCLQMLRKLLNQCKGRVVLFDNRTRDGTKKAQQVQQFLSLVNMVVHENGGQPYSNEDFKQIKVKCVLIYPKNLSVSVHLMILNAILLFRKLNPWKGTLESRFQEWIWSVRNMMSNLK